VPAIRLFEALGMSVVGVPVDDQGLVVDLLPPSARLVYVTPSHQYPLGMTMSMPRRRALLRWAERHDAAIIEDDYDTEFRYVDRPLEPLQALDANGRVVYVGSFSKTFSPSVRLGFAVVPPPLAEPIAALRQLIDWHPPIAMQTALAGFINDGLLDKHIRRSRRVYAERQHILTDALSGPLASHLTARPPNAGLHVAAVLREGLGEKEVLQAAARHGLVTSGLHDCFHTTQAHPGLLIGFGAVSTTGLPVALRTLGRILAAQTTGQISSGVTRPELIQHEPGLSRPGYPHHDYRDECSHRLRRLAELEVPGRRWGNPRPSARHVHPARLVRIPGPAGRARAAGLSRPPSGVPQLPWVRVRTRRTGSAAVWLSAGITLRLTGLIQRG
jgi:hypothetical protein